MPSRRLPLLLFIAYLIFFAILAISPYDRATWWAENIPVMLVVGFLVFTYRAFAFSNIAYLMMAVFIFLHTVGGHFTFERVPFDFIKDLFGFERNHYDRIAHFSVGFYAYAIAEFVEKRRLSASLTLTLTYASFAIFFVAAGYEIIEWWYAALANPEAGTAFLGSQGDIWDAQQDMLADGLGSWVAVGLYAWRRGR